MLGWILAGQDVAQADDVWGRGVLQTLAIVFLVSAYTLAFLEIPKARAFYQFYEDTYSAANYFLPTRVRPSPLAAIIVVQLDTVYHSMLPFLRAKTFPRQGEPCVRNVRVTAARRQTIKGG